MEDKFQLYLIKPIDYRPKSVSGLSTQPPIYGTVQYIQTQVCTDPSKQVVIGSIYSTISQCTVHNYVTEIWTRFME